MSHTRAGKKHFGDFNVFENWIVVRELRISIQHFFSLSSTPRYVLYVFIIASSFASKNDIITTCYSWPSKALRCFSSFVKHRYYRVCIILLSKKCTFLKRFHIISRCCKQARQAYCSSHPQGAPRPYCDYIFFCFHRLEGFAFKVKV